MNDTHIYSQTTWNECTQRAMLLCILSKLSVYEISFRLSAFLYLPLLSDASSPDTRPFTDPVRQLSTESPVLPCYTRILFCIGQYVGSVHYRKM